MEEFIKALTEQMRCVKAREGVAKELMDHIQDQTEAYEESGMSHEEALQAAVQEMGDPVAIGMELDHIHRPKTDWSMLWMVVIFSIAGIVLQYITGILDIGSGRLGNQLLYTMIGLAAMFGVYFLDYSFIGKYAKLVFWGMIILFTFMALFFVPRVNGLAKGLIMPAYLLVPAYAGILYQHRGQRYVGILKCILYMVPAAIFVSSVIGSFVMKLNILSIMCCMLLLAIWKGWFRLNRIKVIVSLLFVWVVFPSGVLTYMYYFMNDYRSFRLQSLFHILDGVSSLSTINVYARDLILDSKWVGTAIDVADSNYQLMQLNGYILTQLIAVYGIWLGVIVVFAFMILLSHMFRITRKQKNQLGFMIGAGCGQIFAVMIIEGILVNVGRFPPTTMYIPFLNDGCSATIVYDILIGLLLSIYRYQNVLSDKSFQPKWKLSLKLEKTMRN